MTPPRTPTTAALHEEHTCRDCGAVITLPYARPPKHIGWAVPDPALLDVEHPDCGDRCACYVRGVDDEAEATRD